MKIDLLCKKLAPLGLPPKEQKVLASLFATGPRAATQIAENTKITRTHVYNVLHELCEKGLAFEVTKNKVKQYAPPPPEQLLRFLSGQKKQLEEAEIQIGPLIPLLMQLQPSKANKPHIRFYWGIDGLKSVYQDTLTCKEKVIYAFCDFEKVFPLAQDPSLNEWMWQYASKRAAAGILYKGILNRSPVSEEAHRRAQEQKRELKAVVGVDFPCEIAIYDKKVAFLSSAVNFMGLVVEDETIAKMMGSIHGVLWKTLPDFT